MRIAILAAEPIGPSLGRPLAEAGHDVVLAPADAADLLPVDVVVVAAAGAQARAAIEDAATRRGADSFVVALVSGSTSDPARARVTVGELNNEASARAVRVARILQEAGLNTEVSLDLDAALDRQGSGQGGGAGGESRQEGSAGGDGSDACRRC